MLYMCGITSYKLTFYTTHHDVVTKLFRPWGWKYFRDVELSVLGLGLGLDVKLSVLGLNLRLALGVLGVVGLLRLWRVRGVGV